MDVVENCVNFNTLVPKESRIPSPVKLEQLYDDDDPSDTDYLPKKKRRRNKQKGYQKGGKTTKNYKIAMSLMSQVRKIDSTNRLAYLKDQCITLGLDKSEVAQVACSVDQVVNDLALLDEDAVGDIAKEISLHSEVENDAITQLSSANYFEIQKKKEECKFKIDQYKKYYRWILYFEHLNANYKDEGIALSNDLFNIAATLRK